MRVVAALFLAALTSGAAQGEVLLSDREIAQTLTFGPWPPQFEPDPSNRVSGDPRAIELGAALFRDPRLSVDGSFSCASCHQPEDAFASSQARALGRELLDRNSPSLRNLAGIRWYGWGGRSDNLWAASLLAITAEDEMANSPENWKVTLSLSDHSIEFETFFGEISSQSPQEVLVNTGKLLAAYQETLVTGRTPFDDFRDALAEGDRIAAGKYRASAQRGLQLFLGRGRCVFCHNGPRFSNNEFHDAGVPYFVSETKVDPGRFVGLKLLLTSPYTLDGIWSDDPDKTGAWAVRNVLRSHADFGTFRTPALRGVAETAPFMHDGSLQDLMAVVRHYDEINQERLHSDGENILEPLNLTESERNDLIAFLRSLSVGDSNR